MYNDQLSLHYDIVYNDSDRKTISICAPTTPAICCVLTPRPPPVLTPQLLDMLIGGPGTPRHTWSSLQSSSSRHPSTPSVGLICTTVVTTTHPSTPRRRTNESSSSPPLSRCCVRWWQVVGPCLSLPSLVGWSPTNYLARTDRTTAIARTRPAPCSVASSQQMRVVRWLP